MLLVKALTKLVFAIQVLLSLTYLTRPARCQFEIIDAGRAFEEPGFLSAAGQLAYDDSRHRLAMIDEGRDMIMVFNLTDHSHISLGLNGELGRPNSLAFDKNGFLYILQDDNDGALKYRPELEFPDTLELSQNFIDKFRPSRIAIGNNFEILVADKENKAVIIFDKNGGAVRLFTDKLRSPDGLMAIKSGSIFVADKGADPIIEYSRAGEFVRHLAAAEDPALKFNISAGGLATDQRGWFYTLDITNNRVISMDPTGVNRIEWRSPEPAFFPRDIAIDKFDDIYISEGGLGRVMVIRKER